MIEEPRPVGELGESVVDEVRMIRETVDAEHRHDVRRLAEHARRVSEQIRREFGMKVAETPSTEDASP